MNGMFMQCFKLKKLDISNFNLNNLVDASFMFSECRSLKELNLPSFKQNQKIKMEQMLAFCEEQLRKEIRNKNNDLKKEAFIEQVDIVFPL